MRTTYVVLVLTMLSAASSYGWELGVQGGVRDWESTNKSDVRFTPQGTLLIGKTITPNSPFRVDAVASAWTRETRIYSLSGYSDVAYSRTTERSGYAFGARVQLDNRQRSESGRRLGRPYIGAGWLWTVQKEAQPSWFGDGGYVEYWDDQWAAEALLGIAIPSARTADFLIQYTFMAVVPFRNRTIDDEYGVHALSLGYRFSVMD